MKAAGQIENLLHLGEEMVSFGPRKK